MSSAFPDPSAQSQLEQGYTPPEPAPAPHLPPGGGRLVAPHFYTFGQIVNYVSRTYRWAFDEALRHSQTNALAIRRDPVIMDALRSRQIPTAQLQWHLECENDQDTAQQEGSKKVTKIIEQIPRFQTLKMQLLEGIWYGKYATQLVYGWDFTTGEKRLVVRDHKPINGDKLVFRYSGQPGLLVHATFPGEMDVTDRGRAHFLTPDEREHVIIHKHEPEDADFFEPELAASVHGVGIRSRVYWFWWLRAQVSAWLMDYLERVGAGGFTIYYYEAGNPESMSEVKLAAEEQHKNNTVLFPRYRDGSTGGPGIQRIEPSNAGAQLLQALISNYFDNVIRRYILGQNLTSETAGTGLGSGVADLHADTFARLVKYDALNLADTLTSDLVRVIQKYTCPGIPPLRFVFDVDKPNSSDVLEAAQIFWNLGGTLDENQLRGVIGLEKPVPGQPMLAKMGAMSPMAAGALPTGVPFMGPPGPPGMGPDPQGMGGMGAPMQMRRRGDRVRLGARDLRELDRKFPGRIRIYKNLHLTKQLGRDIYSVMDKATRRVLGHVNDITLKEVAFPISRAGRRRAEESKVRNVHAFVEGLIDQGGQPVPQENPLTYHPFNPAKRTFEIKGATPEENTPVTHADRASLLGGRFYVQQPRDSGERVSWSARDRARAIKYACRALRQGKA